MKKGIILSAILGIALSGCSSDSDETSYPLENPTLSDIQGIWDISFNYPEQGMDLIYRKITNNGDITVYDFLGDEVSAYDNCYATANFPAQIEDLGSGLFKTEFSQSGDDVRIDFEQIFSLSMPSSQELYTLMSEEHIKVVSDIEGTTFTINYTIDYVSAVEMDVEVRILYDVTTATFIKNTTTNEWEIYNEVIDPAHEEFSDELYNIIRLFDIVTEVTHTRYIGEESDFSPSCSSNIFTTLKPQKELKHASINKHIQKLTLK